MKTTQTCFNCGRSFSIWDLTEMNTGRKRVYICYECMKTGQKQVDQRVIRFFQNEKSKKQKGH